MARVVAPDENLAVRNAKDIDTKDTKKSHEEHEGEDLELPSFVFFVSFVVQSYAFPQTLAQRVVEFRAQVGDVFDADR